MKVAVLGATGAVGRTMLRVLEHRAFPVDELVLVASARSEGATLEFVGREWPVHAVSAAAFEDCDFAFFSAGAARSREWAPIAAAAGAIVIDNSSAWRMDPEVPLVVPEVNGQRAALAPKGIVANPNCATIQLVVALEAIRRAAGLRRVVVTTLQSVSGAGAKGIRALEHELAGQPTETPFIGPIAGNVIPFIGARAPDGWNEEEEKIRQETRKILALPDLRVTATCVRVPVRVGHAASVTVELDRAAPRAQLHEALASMPGISVYGDEADPTPIDVAGTDAIRVGRFRIDPDDPRVVHFWVVADNLRKGAATNAVQIVERVLHG